MHASREIEEAAGGTWDALEFSSSAGYAMSGHLSLLVLEDKMAASISSKVSSKPKDGVDK